MFFHHQSGTTHTIYTGNAHKLPDSRQAGVADDRFVRDFRAVKSMMFNNLNSHGHTPKVKSQLCCLQE
jgi:hypothetical protein